VVKKIQISDLHYINFLVAATCDVSCVKAADCYSLWNEVEPYIEKRNGWFVLDDTVIDKMYSKQIELTCYQWSGKHHKVV
jgi:putative transposase